MLRFGLVLVCATLAGCQMGVLTGELARAGGDGGGATIGDAAEASVDAELFLDDGPAVFGDAVAVPSSPDAAAVPSSPDAAAGVEPPDAVGGVTPPDAAPVVTPPDAAPVALPPDAAPVVRPPDAAVVTPPPDASRPPDAAAGPVCGDDVCAGTEGEMCTTCASDCATMRAVCGNGACEAGETSASCGNDCGPSPWPAASTAFELEVVAEINAQRAAGTDCPGSPKGPMGPLAVNAKLQRAAELHSWDQAHSGYFSHMSCNGRTPWQRAEAQGTNAGGETLGGGYGSAASVVAGWMGSPGHCEILMGGYAEVGVGHAAAPGTIWTAMFR